MTSLPESNIFPDGYQAFLRDYQDFSSTSTSTDLQLPYSHLAQGLTVYVLLVTFLFLYRTPPLSWLPRCESSTPSIVPFFSVIILRFQRGICRIRLTHPFYSHCYHPKIGSYLFSGYHTGLFILAFFSPSPFCTLHSDVTFYHFCCLFIEQIFVKLGTMLGAGI